MQTEIVAVKAARKAMLCVAVVVLVGGSGCFNSMDSKKGSGGASGAGGAGAHGSGGSTGPGGSKGSGGSNGNDAGPIDSPVDTGGAGGTDPVACKMDADCSTGHCVDGLCCDTACDGQCESCKQPDSMGTCKPVKGAPVAPRAACDGTGMCAGTCDGTNSKTCTFPDENTVCTAATCVSGKVTTASTCNGAGACSTSLSSMCPNNQCAAAGGAKCETSCTATSCPAGSYCDTTGVCLMGQPNGASCSSGTSCASGYCADGVCCDGKCDGQCESCKEASSLGKCTALKGAPLATRTACGGTGTCKGQCDGTNRMACAFPDSSTVCTAASCTAGKATSASVCNGSGACTMATTNPCTTNLCATDGSGKCSGSCTATSCTAGTYCDSTGTCAKTLDNGASCSTATQCTSGNCVDGVCCDGKCDGQCQSCKESGSVGKCKVVKGDPISPRAACGGTGKCKAQCDGTNAMTCKSPDSTTVCTPASCTGGKVTTASVCNGSGSCTTTSTNGCGSNLCAADGMTCAGSCTATSCAAGTYCGAGGACAPTIADGKTCSADNQCTNGHCVSGVCCNTTCGACHSCSTGTCKTVAVATACTASGGGAGVCDSTGTCNACSAGTSCTVTNQCQTGAIDCSTGTAVCKASNKNNGTPCGNGPSCSGGQAKAQDTCVTGTCTPGGTSPCQSGGCTGTMCTTCTAPTAPTSISVSGSPAGGPYCGGKSVSLSVVNGSLGSGVGAKWVWYPNSSLSGSVGTGATINQSPSATMSYYVRGEGPCGSSTAVSTQVSIRSAPQIAQGPSDYTTACDGSDSGWISFHCSPTSDTSMKSVQWHAAFSESAAQSHTDAIDWTVDGAHKYFSGQNTLTLMVATQSTVWVWCTITDTCDRTVNSNYANLHVSYIDGNGVCQ